MIVALVRVWVRALTQPGVQTYREEISSHSNCRTLVGVCLAALVGIVLSLLVHQVAGVEGERFMGLASIWVAPGTSPPLGVPWSVIVPLGVVVGFLNFEIALFVVARLIGGKGSIVKQAYAQSLFYAPLSVLQQVFAAIPVLGHYLFAVMAVYSLVPTTTSLKAVHGYSTTRAVLTWVLPIVVNVLVTAIVIALIMHSKAAV